MELPETSRFALERALALLERGEHLQGVEASLRETEHPVAAKARRLLEQHKVREARLLLRTATAGIAR